MHCVITGAADGIGKALAQRFAAAGYSILGIDVDAEQALRTRTALQADAATVSFMIGDLAQERELTRISETLSHGPAIDVFIHNAGINCVGRFAASVFENQETVVAVNFLAPLVLTAGLLRAGKLCRGSSLVFVSSLSCFVSYPGAAVYAAAKAGLASYARSLAVALAPREIHVLTVFPGPTRTAHARRYSPDNRNPHRRMPPEAVADQIYHAVRSRRRTLIPGFGNKLFAALGRYCPRVTEWLMRKLLLRRMDERLKQVSNKLREEFR